MTVEREFAGFALPFAAGVLSVSLSSTITYHAACAAIMPGCIAAALFLNAYSGRSSGGSHIMESGIALVAFLTGAFCFLNDALLQITTIGKTGPLASIAHSCCTSVQEMIDSIPFSRESTGALIKALLTGEKSSIPQEVTEAFRASGASHILALSGMHLGIIYGIVTKLLSPAGNSRQAVAGRSLATVAVCGFYTMAVGAGESIVRAFLFIFINETARLTHRHRSLRQTLLCALTVQLALSPSSIGSVGFQLSYAAMAGIAYIHPWLKSFWPDDGSGPDPFRKIWEMASMSISCQITTGPLAWHYFRSFPPHFLLTNLMAIPLTGVIIPASLLTVLLHSLSICPEILIRFTEFLVSTMSGLLTMIAGM